MYRMTVTAQAWPTAARTYAYEAATLMALRKHVRDWREFSRYEDNHVTGMYVVEVDLAHEADMDCLRKEQLRADIDAKEANEEALAHEWGDCDF
jgi:hypothetical protein